MHRDRYFRWATTALVATVTMLVSGLEIAAPAAANPPDVHIVDPANIVIDGNSNDWDNPGQDKFANLPTLGNGSAGTIAHLYARYSCDAERMYVFVNTLGDWVVVPSDADNFVKKGDELLVNGSSSNF